MLELGVSRYFGVFAYGITHDRITGVVLSIFGIYFCLLLLGCCTSSLYFVLHVAYTHSVLACTRYIRLQYFLSGYKLPYIRTSSHDIKLSYFHIFVVLCLSLCLSPYSVFVYFLLCISIAYISLYLCP